MYCTTVRHWRAFKAVLMYLAATVHTGITYGSLQCRSPTLALRKGFCDASFVVDHENRTSTSGAVIKYNGAPIFWTSRKQTTMEISTSEAELLPLAAASQQLQAVKQMFTGNHLMVAGSRTLKSYNQAVCSMLAKPNDKKLRSYIDLRHQPLQHLIIDNEVKFLHVSRTDGKAEIPSKTMKRNIFVSQCGS